MSINDTKKDMKEVEEEKKYEQQDSTIEQKEDFQNEAKLDKESEAAKGKLYSDLKFEIEKLMEIENSEKFIFKILENILKEAEVFDPDKHFKLIKLLIDTLRKLGRPGTLEFRSDMEASVLRESIVDFLYKLKDKHPCSDPQECEEMDVNNIIMEFMEDFELNPSEELYKVYSESYTTKELNTIPYIKYLQDVFNEDNQMRENTYEELKQRMASRPPFVFFFNTNLQMYITGMGDGIVLRGFQTRSNKQEGAGMYMDKDGCMYQGYYKDNKRHFFGRMIYSDGCIYEGQWFENERHGKGEYIYPDGSREIGQWEKNGWFGQRQGEFDFYGTDGTITKKIYKDDKDVNESRWCIIF